jgi:rhodanese-related sulfurtransferase
MARGFKIWVLVLLILAVAASWLAYRGYDQVSRAATLEGYGAYLREKFDTVDHISTATLASRIGPGKESGPLLIDCRSAEEFRVSHLPGAINLTTADDIISHLDSSSHTGVIVIYAAVGYRSARLAVELDRRGIEKVENVAGSIFKWANEGRPMVDTTGDPISQVHPFNAFWGSRLEEGVAADLGER